MLLTTPFHSRVEQYCESNDWGVWQGYTTPNSYFDVELEYFAIRSTAGVLDLSPMNKYRITGPDAESFLNRLVTRNVSKIGIDRVGYAVWCNDAGELMDDGTIYSGDGFKDLWTLPGKEQLAIIRESAVHLGVFYTLEPPHATKQDRWINRIFFDPKRPPWEGRLFGDPTVE